MHFIIFLLKYASSVTIGNSGQPELLTTPCVLQIGFRLVEALGDQAGVTIDKQQHNALVARALLWNHRVLLAKPTTFMNDSGRAVSKLSQYYKVGLALVRIGRDNFWPPHLPSKTAAICNTHLQPVSTLCHLPVVRASRRGDLTSECSPRVSTPRSSLSGFASSPCIPSRNG